MSEFCDVEETYGDIFESLDGSDPVKMKFELIMPSLSLLGCLPLHNSTSNNI